MADYQLTIDRDLVQQLFLNNDGIARLLEQIVNQVLQGHVTEHLRAERYERTSDRRGYRNGTRQRLLTTRVGALFRVHLAPLPEDDVRMSNGIRSTTPARAIVDAAATGTDPTQIHRAVGEALARGLVDPDTVW